jgi:uncharacterized protein DUF3105
VGKTTKARGRDRSAAPRTIASPVASRPIARGESPRPRASARLAPHQGKARKASTTIRLVALGVAVAIVAIVGALLATGVIGSPPATFGRQVPDQGREHIAQGQAHLPYNTTPPTSGPHYVDPAPWGIYTQSIADETQVHNLEHGGIMIQYWCPDGCPDLVSQLTTVASRYKSKVILAPYSKPMPNRIALTSWTWIDTFDNFDEARITQFIAQHKDHAPEQVPD